MANSSIVVRGSRRLIFNTAADLANNRLRDDGRRMAIQQNSWRPLEPVADVHIQSIPPSDVKHCVRQRESWPGRTREIFILNR